MFLKFERWSEVRIAELESSDPLLTCPECSGTQIVEEVCGCCGHESEQDCGLCETGRLRYSDFPLRHRGQLTTWGAYSEAILADAQALSEWKAVDPARPLFDAELAPFTAISHQVVYDPERRVVGFKSLGLRIANPR